MCFGITNNKNQRIENDIFMMIEKTTTLKNYKRNLRKNCNKRVKEERRKDEII